MIALCVDEPLIAGSRKAEVQSIKNLFKVCSLSLLQLSKFNLYRLSWNTQGYTVDCRGDVAVGGELEVRDRSSLCFLI